jgi:hypothetical protein
MIQPQGFVELGHEDKNLFVVESHLWLEASYLSLVHMNRFCVTNPWIHTQ